MTREEITARLSALADSKYKAFNSKIICSSLPSMGVRTPDLKSVAKEYAADAQAFYACAPLTTFDEVLLYGFVIGSAKQSHEETLKRLDFLIPKMSSWAHVDQTVSAVKALGKEKVDTLKHFMPLQSGSEYERRFLVILLMNYYLVEDNLDDVFQILAKVQNEQYYVNMAVAWALSVALVKFYDRTVLALTDGGFSPWVHNKAIQKANESFRISQEKKEALRKLKVKV